jgi:hypothetical protein
LAREPRRALRPGRARNLTETGARDLAEAGIRHLTNTGVRDLTETRIRDLAKTGIRHLTNTGVRDLTKTRIRHLTNTGIRHLTNTGVRDLTKTRIRDLTKTGIRHLTEARVRREGAARHLTLQGPADRLRSALPRRTRRAAALSGRGLVALRVELVAELVGAGHRASSFRVHSALPSATPARPAVALSPAGTVRT